MRKRRKGKASWKGNISYWLTTQSKMFREKNKCLVFELTQITVYRVLVISIIYGTRFQFVQCWEAVSLEVKYSCWLIAQRRPCKSLWQELENTDAYAYTRGYLSGWTVATKTGIQQGISTRYSWGSKKVPYATMSIQKQFILFKSVISFAYTLIQYIIFQSTFKSLTACFLNNVF